MESDYESGGQEFEISSGAPVNKINYLWATLAASAAVISGSEKRRVGSRRHSPGHRLLTLVCAPSSASRFEFAHPSLGFANGTHLLALNARLTCNLRAPLTTANSRPICLAPKIELALNFKRRIVCRTRRDHFAVFLHGHCQPRGFLWSLRHSGAERFLGWHRCEQQTCYRQDR